MLAYFPRLISIDACLAAIDIAKDESYEWRNARPTTHERDMVMELHGDGLKALRAVMKRSVSVGSAARIADATRLCGGGSFGPPFENTFFFRYNTFSEMGPHKDVRPPTEARGDALFATVLVYLNDDYCGGQFSWYVEDESGRSVLSGSIQPGAGDVIVLRNDLLHSAGVVTCGMKYIGVTHCL